MSKQQDAGEYRPIVGIPCRYNWTTFYYELRETYSEAIYAAGGAPILLPLIPEPDYINSIVDHLDAVCLSGAGNDVDPLRYGREPKPLLGPVVPRRDETDALLLASAEKRNLPILAICFGIQSLNVCRGGTLVQDIGSEVQSPLKHMQGDVFDRRSHSITVTKNSLLAELAGSTKAVVNSHHHQAIELVGRDLEAVAWANDGVVEAVVDTRPDHFVLGVQWHPEVGWQGDALSQAIFNRFIAEARDRSRSRLSESARA
ncbi:MAG TPA: gamma-glutamyl-gamma-aminobutyrate hydrolase family protein [Blastocatellia bacterium]|nr:gamma-glutamyl-gamma-aminobutyrate hydrolase family protein [Blastocatellia bacterium]